MKSPSSALTETASPGTLLGAMTLPRTARSIVVGGRRYRWMVSDMDTRSFPAWEVEHIHYLTVVIQLATGTGQKLVRRWKVHYPRRPEEQVLPSAVRGMIEIALTAGWTPDRPGPPFSR